MPDPVLDEPKSGESTRTSERLTMAVTHSSDLRPASNQLELGSIPARRRNKDRLFGTLCLMALLVGVVMLGILLFTLLKTGLGSLSWKFLTSKASSIPSRAGIFPPLIGSLWVVILTGLIAVPVGVAAAVYLEEFQRKRTWFRDFVQVNIANLAGVPSIIYGLLGLGVFVYFFGFGRSVISAALTMSLLVLPMIIMVTQEALRAVPDSLREGSLALGATRWQTIHRQVLPAAMPSIYTGIILSLSRAIGESAPLLTVGAVTFVTHIPTSIHDKYTVLPLQIYNWINLPKPEFKNLAAAAILVLLITLMTLNAIAIWLRSRSKYKANA